MNTSLQKPFLLAPSILSADFTHLGDQIREAEEAGVDWIHVDVIDGHFAPNITMGPFIVEACRRVTQLPLDVHLMIENPDRWIATFASAGASSITVHVEATAHLHRMLQTIREVGCKAGVVLNPATPAVMVEPVLHMVDMVLAMTVNPGFSGQEFAPEVLEKIKLISRSLEALHSNALIEVDGGMGPKTLPLAYAAGARVFVAGHGIFRHPQGIAFAVNELRNCLDQH